MDKSQSAYVIIANWRRFFEGCERIQTEASNWICLDCKKTKSFFEFSIFELNGTDYGDKKSKLCTLYKDQRLCISKLEGLHSHRPLYSF